MLLFFYALPALIAIGRSHPRSGAIVMLTILAGWTGVGWILALMWARGPGATQPLRTTEAARRPPRPGRTSWLVRDRRRPAATARAERPAPEASAGRQ